MKKYLTYLYLLSLGLLIFFLFKTRQQSYFRNAGDLANIEDTSASAVKSWQPAFQLYDPKEVAQGLQISKDSMGITEADATIQKVSKIGIHLVSTFHSFLGDPEAFVFEQTPLQAYYSIKKRQTELYCTQYSLIFTFFCRINNITTRRIESYGKNDRHTFNEVYLPETKEWVYSDLTYNILYSTEDAKNVSFIGLYRALHEKENSKPVMLHHCINRKDSVTPLIPFKDTLLYNFDDKAMFIFHYEQPATGKVMRRLTQYLSSRAPYLVYTRQTNTNILIYLKYLSMLLLLCFTYILFSTRKKF